MKHTLASLVIGLFLLMGTASASAQDYQKGVAAANAGDFATALKEWRSLAEQGHTKAQVSLGLMYYAGRDYKGAVKWYRLAAEQGSASAQFNLAVMYVNGLGVVQDDKEAVKWFRLAAEQGDADAQLSLGGMYDNGRGVVMGCPDRVVRFDC